MTKFVQFLTQRGGVCFVNPARVCCLIDWPLTHPVSRETQICTLIDFGGPEDTGIVVQGHVTDIVHVLGLPS